YPYPDHLAPQSFPTRRSSDLLRQWLGLNGLTLDALAIGRRFGHGHLGFGRWSLTTSLPAAALLTALRRSLTALTLRRALILSRRSEEHTSELQSQSNHVCRLL